MSSVLATADRFDGCCGVCTEAVSGFQTPSAVRAANWLLQNPYISRSRLPDGLRRIEREAELDQLLLNRGWTVIHPEQLSVNEQLRHLRQAQVIAGPLGSAFHLLFAFGSLPAGPLLLTLGFPGELTTDGPGLNFGLQFRRQQILVEHLPLLALQDPALDPSKVPRHLPLRFVIEPEAVAQRLEHHAAAFLADLPQ